MLERIGTCAHDMGALVDDLLQLARVDRTCLCVEPVDLSAIARSICEEMQLREPGRAVTLDIQDNLQASADSGLLRIAMSNLLANAWKFTGKLPAPRISVGARQHDGKTLFFVRDNGAGFDPSLADKLFMPFQRLHHKKDFPGTGIGLATVRRIVEHHGGRIWAQSRAGHGATFFFTLGGSPSEA